MKVHYETRLPAGKGTVLCKVYQMGTECGLALWDEAKDMPFGRKSRTMGYAEMVRLADAMRSAKNGIARAAIVWAKLGYDCQKYRNEKAMASTICHPGRGNKVA